MSSTDTMKAVIFDGLLKDDGDVIVKVHMTALCGSELHVYRGIEPSGTGYVMGHEFTGTVVATGSGVQSVKIGDRVVSPFTTSCDKCFYCRNGGTSRCINSQPFGSECLDGAQAEYVRVPQADGTITKAPATIPEQALILMADIFPTGYFGVKSALEMMPRLQVQDATIVVIGCGPVGLCAIASAAALQPLHLFAVDSVGNRLDQAKKLGAEPLNFATNKSGMEDRILQATDGRGADIVVEVVGLSPALRTAFDLVRPFGAISSIGVHNAEIPWSGAEAYNKNIRLQLGRCPVRSIFSEAIELLEQTHHSLGFLFENIMPLSNALKGYELFNQSKVPKVIFQADSMS